MDKPRSERKIMPWSKVPTAWISNPVWLSLSNTTRLNHIMLFLFATRLDYGGAFILNDKELSIEQISIALHVPAEDILATFQELEKDNFVSKNGSGWKLTDFPYERNYYQKVCREASRRMKKYRKNRDDNHGDVTENVTRNKQRTFSARTPLKIENQNRESDRDLKDKESSSSRVSAEADDELVRIFKAFGARAKQLEYLKKTTGIKPGDIWAMAAQVRHDDRIRKPNYIALENILLGERASAEWYDESYWEVIPAKIRQAGGLVVRGGGDVSEQVTGSGYTNNLKPDKTVDRHIAKNQMTAQQAWQSAQGQLQLEMPKATFDKWVRDAVLVHWEADLMQIGVHNSYAKEWLESRLSSTITRLLTGICNQVIEVEFVVVKESS